MSYLRYKPTTGSGGGTNNTDQNHSQTEFGLGSLWHLPPDNSPGEDQQVLGTAGQDAISGSHSADILVGGSGADTISGGSGDDMLLGGRFESDFDPFAATVFRMYRATLDRAPDAEGLRGWTEMLSGGQRDLTDVARGFVNSAEFQGDYGGTSNAEFVTLLYNNVLGRGPDAAGLQHWSEFLGGGATRAQVVVGFSESAEFKVGAAAEAVQMSFEASQNNWLDDVYRLYRATLDRDPDSAGLEGWTAQLAAGSEIAQIAGGFTNSREFQDIYGELENLEFVELLYRNVLDRAADSEGLANWTIALATGATRGDVVTGFSQSQEFTNNTANAVASWVSAQGWDDQLEGGSGTNVLFGGMWADSFVFDARNGGTHTVADLEAWDQLCFDGFNYSSAADVRAHLRQDGDDVVFTDQGVELRLVDTDLEFLRDDNLFDI